jgi:UDP-GlcNAc:undecaprenyl-phosphate GlcNAc-1-phosphate transferase
MRINLTHLIYCGIAFGISALLIPVVIRMSRRFNLYDSIDARKIHKGLVSRFGGLAIFIAFVIVGGYGVFPSLGTVVNKWLYIAALFIAFLTGFCDDVKRIKARYKLLLQIAAAVLVAFSGLTLKAVSIYTFGWFHLGVFSYIITIVWVIAFMNAINLIDGMDGLSTGVVLIANVFIFIVSAMTGNFLVTSLAAILGGAILGFYIFNFPPAKIFLGDGGAYFIGFVYATLPLMGVHKTVVLTLFLVPLVLLLVPLADVLQVMLNRYRRGQNIFFPDKTHLHHRLMAVGLSTKGILFVMYTYTVVLGLSSILIISIPPRYAIILLSIIILLLLLSFIMLASAERVIERLTARISPKSARARKSK